MSSNSLVSLYPQARKLQYDLKSQLEFLESGRGGTLDDQRSARQNLNDLEMKLTQLETLVTYESSGKRELWKKKVQQLRDEGNFLKSSLEQYLYRLNRRAVEAQERENLLNRRRGDVLSSSNDTYRTQEHKSLQQSSEMVLELTNYSKTILHSLGEQGSRFKNAHRKVLDVANTLGLSNSLLRVIERRETVDKWIIFGGMFLTMIFFYICWTYLRPS